MSKPRRKMIRQGVVFNDKPEPTVEGYVVAAHDHCWVNRSEVERSTLCGCFYCRRTFPAAEVDYYLTDGTAMCPYCYIDSVIPSAAGYELTAEFLRKMNDFWF